MLLDPLDGRARSGKYHTRKMAPKITLDPEVIAEYFRRWAIRELSVFGSVLHEDFGPDSDVDVLVEFDTTAKWGLFDLVRMENELTRLIGRKVDLVERRGLEQSENYILRQRILESLERVYVA